MTTGQPELDPRIEVVRETVAATERAVHPLRWIMLLAGTMTLLSAAALAVALVLAWMSS